MSVEAALVAPLTAEGRMVSYAQNREDVVLGRIFRDRPQGFFVDVGACHPVHDSVTQHFHLRGWHGVNVEPQPALFALLQQERPGDVNLAVCVGARRARARLYVTADSGTSTATRELAERYRAQGRLRDEVDVEVVTLTDIWRQHVGRRRVDFLKIDVEGMEREVLEGADFSVVDPLVIVIESVQPQSRVPAWMTWEPVLLGHYRPFLSDGINRFYHRLDFPLASEALGMPANFLDNFVSYREYLTEEACRHLAERVEGCEVELRNFRAWLDQKDAALADAARAYAALEAHYRPAQTGSDPSAGSDAVRAEGGACRE